MSACPHCGHDPAQLDLSMLTTGATPPAHKARRRDSDTAKSAAVLAFPRAGLQRRRALNAIAASDGGMTSEEVAAWLGSPYVSISTRLSELRDGGWIEDSGRRRKTSSRTAAIVWVASHAGRGALERERSAVAA